MGTPAVVDRPHALEFTRSATPEINEKFRGMSIIEIDDTGGDKAMYDYLHQQLFESELTAEERVDVMRTVDFMLDMHSESTRSDGRDMTYGGHLLRTTLKLWECEIRDPEMLKAMVAHDVVEDHPEKVVARLGGNIHAEDIQAEALRVMRPEFGDDMVDLVEVVTHPAYTSKETKNREYLCYVAKVMVSNPRAAAIKIMDGWDNACNNFRTTNAKLQAKLDVKYFPAFGQYLSGLATADCAFSNAVREWLRAEFITGMYDCGERIQLAGTRQIGRDVLSSAR